MLHVSDLQDYAVLTVSTLMLIYFAGPPPRNWKKPATEAKPEGMCIVHPLV